MKRKVLGVSFALAVLAATAILAVFLTYRKDRAAQTDTYSGLEQTEAVSRALGSLNITVDPRIELLTAVQQQSGYERLTNLDFTYKGTVMKYFSKYKNHKAVKTFRSLSKSGFSYDAPPHAMLFLTNPPALEEKQEIAASLNTRASGKKKLTDFIADMRSFYTVSDFQGFFNQNLPLYRHMIDQVYTSIQDMKLIETLDGYYGMDVNSYHLILSPLLHNGGYGPSVKADNGLYDIYGIIGPNLTAEGENGEMIPEFSSESIRYIVWHEFGHSFVNPATEKNNAEINKYQNLYTPISAAMKTQAYTNWETCVNEHIIRAVTARLTYLDQGQEAYEAAIENERSRGFFYVPALCDSLAIYESSRDKYPAFDSYFPALVKVFQTLSEQELGSDFFQIDFTGPINSAFSNMDSTKIVIIVPTQEKDTEIQQDIVSYAEAIRDKFFAGAEIVEDRDALERALGDHLIIAYGTMEGNLWLKHYRNSFPFEVAEDRITVGQGYEDTGLVLISALPNPQNYRKPLLVYTAQDAKDIIEINTVFHGPTDYVVAKDGKELGSGFYHKSEEIWIIPD